MFPPLIKLLKRFLWCDIKYKHCNLDIFQEEMRQMMDIGHACCIPDIQLDIFISSIITLDIDQSGEVIDHRSILNLFVFLKFIINESFDDGCFANLGIAHEDDLCILDFIADAWDWHRDWVTLYFAILSYLFLVWVYCGVSTCDTTPFPLCFNH